MILILIFTFILNAVAILLTYYSLQNMEKKDRIIFVGVGVAIMYMITSLIYWISTKGVEIKEVSEIGKNLITFIFVPINGIITLPIIAKSYSKYKSGKLALDKLRNRIIVIAIPFIIILIVECSYFKDIQNGVIQLVQSNSNKQQTSGTTNVIDQNSIDQNSISQNVIDSNSIDQNRIENQIQNEVNNSSNNETKTNSITNKVEVVY